MNSQFYVANSSLGQILWALLMFKGFLLLSFGLLVLAFPELLIYLVAVGFVFVGASIMGFAWRLRSLNRRPYA